MRACFSAGRGYNSTITLTKKISIMAKKAVIFLIALCAFGSIGGVFLGGLNFYTRSVDMQKTNEANGYGATAKSPLTDH